MVAATAAAKAAADAEAAAAKATPVPKKLVSTPRPEDILPLHAEQGKPFLLTIGGIITILVLLGIAFAGWAVYNKLRHRANDVLE